MLKCKIVHRPEEGSRGTRIAESFCETHGVKFEYSAAMDNDTCPMGYISDIERRVHHALQEFREEMRQMRRLYARIARVEEALGIDEVTEAMNDKFEE